MKKIKKILIANRSEIACRIIKTCKKLGIKTVAVYSDADKNSLHKDMADESHYIGEATASDSYLNINKLIKLAKKSKCDAIHPGYGFLSENESFIDAINKAGLIFIGPSKYAVSHLGSKVASRDSMIKAGVPVIPGLQGKDININDIKRFAKKYDYPILIKASAGGGGKGMRVIEDENQLKSSIESAKREALSAFGDDTIFVEKYLEEPKHIEFQVAGDKHGNYIHLFERECSIQRRHQKIIEETPSLALTKDLREKMAKAAIEAIKTVAYDSVGTVEFLYQNNKFYFLEVNTRIQVEHPITEMTTGIDLIKLQIEIAEGKKIPYNQSDIIQQGHSIECRIYAEDADNDFMPTGGKIHFLKEAEGNGIRCDSGIKEGMEISSFYDPIMSKLITHANTREKAIEKMINALENNVILGVRTSTAFMISILRHKSFKNGKYSTNFIKQNFDEIKVEDNILPVLSLIAINEHKILSKYDEVKSPWELINKSDFES